ncbi:MULTISPECIES: aspartate--tRNA ligase [Lysinibacillus]|uniref:Aspartate--tRNA ligase n=1 Tax=Lysinibacillus boronitolerans JCM 21713 = 10a = NBRC 103108 TaxID=1294264 RepID=A0ABR4Y246_9BACI|nr:MULTISPECIES: aspartate--tRNA ligase [Lysinibacillus]EFI69434.1 aspartyl-tRNA synthetase [Lysinibacillus fusiformis ZC1]EKU41330.1 aspartyl-tRNA synthetase [Lysinibacillus fusiformis ZB2]AUS87648.1 aspartate--tRNA ligase [Lysinibacillus sp. YS11]KGR87633.1 aspartate--tRNA ligase [Lysinibacillus boronitolerans JCM 21713 = 10a = NBRC 103108]MCM0624383.1 aspartate--tRNA ligase [Lysinibacillus sp. OL1_EC]
MATRTHASNELSEALQGEKVVLKGWVQRRRDLGGLIFIDLRDRTGITQVVFSPDVAEAHALADKVRSEYVIEVEGTVILRTEDQINPNVPNGKIEVEATKLVVINTAKTTPFQIEDRTDVSEDLRLKYRYLDLRRPVMFDTFKMRSDVTRTIRNFLQNEGFLEVETPILTKSTPEGARDYLVPSRVHEGEFYALPQSPQLFKQLLMVAGFEKYFQIARCFRDEDLRADRQPEFTQVDIETSFLTQEEVLEMNERLIQAVMKEVKGIDIPAPFQRMKYQEAMDRYGSDKPDVRFGLELVALNDIFEGCNFKVFADTVAQGKQVKSINIKGAADKYSRKDMDELTKFVGIYGAKGLAWLKVTEEGLNGPIAKFFDEALAAALIERMGAEVGDILVFVADKAAVVAASLGALRTKLGQDLNLIDESQFAFLWITDWPLFEYSEEDGRYYAAHHPFTRPFDEDIALMDTDPAAVRAQAYDIVLNGYELGGGSLRIYERDLQEKMFELLGFSEEEAQAQFGFLLEAFEYGVPPHAGLAFGLDRFVMLLAGRTNLRDTIAFPKTASASCLMTEAPSEVSPEQLSELSLAIKPFRK